MILYSDYIAKLNEIPALLASSCTSVAAFLDARDKFNEELNAIAVKEDIPLSPLLCAPDDPEINTLRGNLLKANGDAQDFFNSILVENKKCGGVCFDFWESRERFQEFELEYGENSLSLQTREGWVLSIEYFQNAVVCDCDDAGELPKVIVSRWLGITLEILKLFNFTASEKDILSYQKTLRTYLRDNCAMFLSNSLWGKLINDLHKSDLTDSETKSARIRTDKCIASLSTLEQITAFKVIHNLTQQAQQENSDVPTYRLRSLVEDVFWERLFPSQKSRRKIYKPRRPQIYVYRRGGARARTSRRSRSSFVAASSHAGSDSGGDDGGGSGDGDGQSDSYHVGAGHEARVNVVVDSQQNKSTEEPGIAARSDALAVAGFFVPFERAEVAA